jgi:hypothetical protein
MARSLAVTALFDAAFAAAAAGATTDAPLPPCTAAAKQKALYLDYDFEPSLEASPATDISVEHVCASLCTLGCVQRGAAPAAGSRLQHCLS